MIPTAAVSSPYDRSTDMTERCFDCDDGGHLADEHCWYEGDICRCGETPLWDVNPVNPCPMAATEAAGR